MPELAQRVESLRLYIRDEASLPQVLQELVMLTVAREMDCAYGATAVFGQRGTMTLTTLVTCFAGLGLFMNTYELPAPPHPTEKPLPV
jgi:hypothetical protein